jgi:hypothetical protein
VNGFHQVAQYEVADVDQNGVQPVLCAIRSRIKVTLRTGVVPSVLVIALIGNDKGEHRHAPGAKVFEQTALALKSHYVA